MEVWRTVTTCWMSDTNGQKLMGLTTNGAYQCTPKNNILNADMMISLWSLNPKALVCQG